MTNLFALPKSILKNFGERNFYPEKKFSSEKFSVITKDFCTVKCKLNAVCYG